MTVIVWLIEDKFCYYYATGYWKVVQDRTECSSHNSPSEAGELAEYSWFRYSKCKGLNVWARATYAGVVLCYLNIHNWKSSPNEWASEKSVPKTPGAYIFQICWGENNAGNDFKLTKMDVHFSMHVFRNFVIEDLKAMDNYLRNI